MELEWSKYPKIFNRVLTKDKEEILKLYPEKINWNQLLELKIGMPRLLHNVYTYADLDEEEKTDYRIIFHIDKNSKNYQGSSNLTNCWGVFDSGNVTDSQNIKSSFGVENSSLVAFSTYVTCSHAIANSRGIENSTAVLNGENVLEGSSVSNSENIENCTNVINGTNIKNSYYIRSSKNLDNCYFCTACADLSNAILCYGMQVPSDSSEYYIYNKRVSKKVFEMVKAHLLSLEKMPDFATIMSDGSVSFVDAAIPENFADKMPREFWQFATEVPNYNEDIFYAITQLNKN